MRTFILPPHKKADPRKLAEECIEQFSGALACILIPGTQFDLNGTRRGKGGGWYDRFLSRVPSAWLRIGVAHASQVSRTRIFRHPWDESVDWILVHGARWIAHRAERGKPQKRG